MTDSPPSKRPKTDDTSSSCRIMTWNADGLAAKSQSSDYMRNFESLLIDTKPDILCIQEARLKCGNSRGEPQPGELKAVQSLFDLTNDYTKYWSLADSRSAGTLTLVRKDMSLPKSSCAFSVESAITLLLSRYNLQDNKGLKEKIASSNKENSCLVEQPTQQKKAPKQTSMSAFFKPKNNATTTTSSSKQHEKEGRFQFFSFPTFDLINTYVPNNGMKESGYQRRKHFDLQMQHFLNMRNAILKMAAQGKTLLWTGDLNVAHTYLDGSHHTVDEMGNVTEHWTNEAKCLGSEYKRPEFVDAANVGMPGYTPRERERFNQVLEIGNLVDVWRHLHPDGVKSTSFMPSCDCKGWNRPNYTWRGAVGRNMARAKYQGKAQRIDYFLLSSQAMDRVESCDILGYDEYRKGYFCGSDHCPVLLVLKAPGE